MLLTGVSILGVALLFGLLYYRTKFLSASEGLGVVKDQVVRQETEFADTQTKVRLENAEEARAIVVANDRDAALDYLRKSFTR